MAKRNKTKVTVSLFPFLSILACVMGVLTLMITALALSQMDTESIASMFEFDKLKSQVNDIKEEIRKIEEEIARKQKEAGINQEELAALRAKLEALLKEKDALLKTPTASTSVPKVDTAAHEKRMADMQKELEEQKKQREQLLVEAEKRGKPQEAEVVIQPSGSGVGLLPTFVECDASGIVIYEGKEPTRVLRAQLGSNEKYLSLLKRVADRPSASVIFLIRDDGLSSYEAARRLAQSNFARNGKLPVIGHGKIDLSVFQK